MRNVGVTFMTNGGEYVIDSFERRRMHGTVSLALCIEFAFGCRLERVSPLTVILRRTCAMSLTSDAATFALP
jgi:hypothetical protein